MPPPFWASVAALRELLTQDLPVPAVAAVAADGADGDLESELELAFFLLGHTGDLNAARDAILVARATRSETPELAAVRGRVRAGAFAGSWAFPHRAEIVACWPHDLVGDGDAAGMATHDGSPVAIARVGRADLVALNNAVTLDQFKLYFVHVMEYRLRVLELMWEARRGVGRAGGGGGGGGGGGDGDGDDGDDGDDGGSGNVDGNGSGNNNSCGNGQGDGGCNDGDLGKVDAIRNDGGNLPPLPHYVDVHDLMCPRGILSTFGGSGKVNGWDGCVDGWMVGWMDGWKE